VAITSRDEVADAGMAFNRMAEEISSRTENLEQLVEARTKEIEQAKEEISALNIQLQGENVRLGAELAVAQRIQLMVLPRPYELLSHATVEIAAYMRPADEVGGDYYDVLQDGTRLKIGIGDVTGHGLESGVLMLMIQSVARALQESGERNPSRFLSAVNRTIYKNMQRTNTDKHLTLAFLDYDDGQVTVSGQHEELIVVRKDGLLERIDTSDLGFPVGLEEDISPFIATLCIDFAEGDLILLHTDGVTEAENAQGELYGIERLCQSALRHRSETIEDLIASVITELMAYVGSQKIHDDITLVALRHR
jgi:sigma-B regulation protein RsbU (phosphoserine phosphatase)